jgi:hypothetical protein
MKKLSYLLISSAVISVLAGCSSTSNLIPVGPKFNIPTVSATATKNPAQANEKLDINKVIFKKAPFMKQETKQNWLKQVSE